MKKICTSVVVILVLLAVLYTGHWFYRANKVKELVLHHLNEYAKPDEEGYHVKVQDVSVSGFPFNYIINLTNPKYELANQSKSPEEANWSINGTVKIGTDFLGKTYWIKREGDLHYFLPPQDKNQQPQKYIVKGHPEVQVDVVHPQYFQAFMHPFFGLPKAFYKKNPTFKELFNEIRMVKYDDEHFVLYEGDEQKPLLEFSKGFINWKHEPVSDEDQKITFDLDLKDLQAIDQGKALLPYLKQLIDLDPNLAIDVPYILHSGKNNIAIAFNARFPKELQLSAFLNHNFDIELKKMEIENLYGRSSMQFAAHLDNEGDDAKNLHVQLEAESKITPEGSAAIHRQFIEGLKLSVKQNAEDPENKVFAELLKCCEDQLQNLIPNYLKLGKTHFTFDMDLKAKDIKQNPTIDRVIVNHLDLTAQPYGIESHGQASFAQDQPQGKYEIQWRNYQEMIHDMVSYFNRIHPILEKLADANKQPLSIASVNEAKEKEIVDFFKSIADSSSQDKSTLIFTIDYTNINKPTIGGHPIEQITQAWDKLVEDLKK